VPHADVAASPRATETAFLVLIGLSGGPPVAAPSDRMFGTIWSTWAHLKDAVSDTAVLEFARLIKQEHSLPGGILEIDDKWQCEYGNLNFDPQKFANPKKMVSVLHQMNFLVTLWVPPFIQEASENFREAQIKGYLVCNQIDWWQGQGYLIDLTNARAMDWWESKLRQLMECTGIDGFKFDAGEHSFLPSVQREVCNLNSYTIKWTELASRFAVSEVRCGWDTSRTLPLLVREFDKASRWDCGNGLKACITSALTLGTLGFPFVLGDMCGGNLYGNEGDVDDRNGEPESQHEELSELYLRWLQMSVGMAALQLSIPPWKFDESVVRQCKRLLKAREDYFLPRVLREKREAITGGKPVVRPLALLHTGLFNVDDQYCLGA